MSKLSKEKEDRIKEEVLRIIYENSPNKIYTNFIADELARDDEFVLRLLQDLHKNGFVNKLQKGRRKMWGLPDHVFNQYKNILS
ncbi:hypothetical protein K8R47_00620 [archaeon]|nr:hypothetical protein [archaeon]